MLPLTDHYRQPYPKAVLMKLLAADEDAHLRGMEEIQNVMQTRLRTLSPAQWEAAVDFACTYYQYLWGDALPPLKGEKITTTEEDLRLALSKLENTYHSDEARFGVIENRILSMVHQAMSAQKGLVVVGISL